MKPLFGGIYAGRRVLVTGHTGFKGSWLCLWLQVLGARVMGLSLPAETDPSHWTLLGLTVEDEAIVDLRDADAVGSSIERWRPEAVFHLAAQSLVRRGYASPVDTFASNVTGLVNLLEALRRCGDVRALVNATTDKVYREPPRPGGYREDDPLGGHDPYSTSKACAELVSDCYRSSWLDAAGTRLATARAGNVIGGGDWAADRLVPDLVRAAGAGMPLRVRHSDAIRPWQHVLEPLSGYLRLGQALLGGEIAGGAWNFGPSPEATLSVGDMVARLRTRWPGVDVETEDGPTPREAGILVLDSGKAARELEWAPVWDADTAIARTIDWYRAFLRGDPLRSHDDLRDYVDAARHAGRRWAIPA